MIRVLVAILTFVSINQIYCEEATNVNSVLPEGMENKFYLNWRKHLKSINEINIPFIKYLKSKGCQFGTNKHKENFTTAARSEACVELTESVGTLESLTLETYNLSQDYVNTTLIGINEASTCFIDKEIAFGFICLLRVVNDTGAQLGALNSELSEIIESEVDTINVIIKEFIICFGSKPSSFRVIAEKIAEEYCV